MSTDPFAELVSDVLGGSGRFGHRAHVHTTWLAVRRYGMPAAIDLVSKGIRSTARYAGVPHKYNATQSRAWVELVAHHAAATPGIDDFDTFASIHSALLDKRLLSRFYRSSTLAGTAARAGWIEPDLAPFPWDESA